MDSDAKEIIIGIVGSILGALATAALAWLAKLLIERYCPRLRIWGRQPERKENDYIELNGLKKDAGNAQDDAVDGTSENEDSETKMEVDDEVDSSTGVEEAVKDSKATASSNYAVKDSKATASSNYEVVLENIKADTKFKESGVIKGSQLKEGTKGTVTIKNVECTTFENSGRIE